MNKPKGFDEAAARQYRGRPKAGYYIGFIKMATTILTKQNPREMMVLLIDIAEGDHKGYFREKLELDKRSDPNAKFKGVHRRVLDQIEEFKGDIQAIEESNAGFQFDFDEKSLVGKIVGIGIGETEFNSEGHTFVEIRHITSVQRVRSGSLSAPLLKKFKPKYEQGADRYNDPSEPLPEYGGDVSEEQLPF
jgi:hypothetical protein